MTIREVLNPRNFMILLCAATVVIIGIKGAHIAEKIDTIKEADRLYAANDLVAAEEAYRQAHNNRWILYEEDKLAERLHKLAPITAMKRKLDKILSDTDAAAADLQFETFMEAYKRYQQLRSSYLEPGSSHINEFKQMLTAATAADRMNEHLIQFKAYFEEQLAASKQRGDSSAESFKANLLTLPPSLFGGAEKKATQLNTLFRSYDESKLARIAGKGELQQMLDEAVTMAKAYQKLGITAEWLQSKSEELAETIMQKDAEQNNAKAFAIHATIYAAYADRSDSSPRVINYLEQELKSWMRKADRHVAAGEYETAIRLYEDLSGFRDTTAEIADVRLVWAAAEPSLLLAEGNYPFIEGGKNRFGAAVYTMALDTERRLYYATWDGSSHPKVLRTQQPIPYHYEVRRLTVEEQLSSNEQPVLLIESDSDSRSASYSAYTVANDRFQLLFSFEADGYKIDNDGSLLVHNLNETGKEDETARYELYGDSYQFVELLPNANYIDILVEQLPEYPRKKVRLTSEIVLNSDEKPYARMGNSYIALQGDYAFVEGPITVCGIFNYYIEVYIDSEIVTIPVFHVEKVE
ncbi:hypothetical protein MNQ98_05680 [Paenibacillus sp. N3/727]|uniref:hypothetical protein n=1 Tax=Paenibacillus sp. N3/727 TaxID=2925845 RepID=UPI001F52ECE3|nr:hypothetical protein [Paenibacillus sp. N3/727]UNK19521.1 hypothetical protein MNQ98_05680 [Paenibacillus sp. N3/727]